MEPVSFTMATLGTAKLCIESLKFLRKTYKAYQGADRSISLTVLQLEGVTYKIDYQCKKLHNLWNELDNDLQVHLNHVLVKLRSSLQEAVDKVNLIVSQDEAKVSIKAIMRSDGDVKKFKYLKLKESLEELMDDIEKWQRIFDPSWYLIARVSSPGVDVEPTPQGSPEHNSQTLTAQNNLEWLKNMHNNLQNVSRSDPYISADTFEPMRESIPFSSCSLAFLKANNKALIADTRTLLDVEEPKFVDRDVRQYASALQTVDTDLGLLKCYGVIKETTNTNSISSFEFMFEIPPELTNPQSLRSLLHSKAKEELTINQKLHVARLAARSVMGIHLAEFVHKNISPDSILILQQNNSNAITYVPFLLGIEKIRHADSQTYHKGDSIVARNLYRHLTRQGTDLKQDFTMQHDIYSLGICLLEVGLWNPFLEFRNGSDKPQVSSLLEGVGLAKLKDRLVKLAREKLPVCMGDVYSEVVISCLTCLDEKNEDFGDQGNFKDQDGVQVAVRYSERVLLRLESIAV